MSLSLLISVGLLSAGLPTVSSTHVTDSIQPVTVTADKGAVISRTDTLSFRNSFTVSDILHQSPGLYVGDYGGPAGLKIVSLRGFGSPHTSIYIDGVKVGNVQSGQGDLGMIGIENSSSAVVDYAQNSISFNTSRPRFGKSPVAGAFRFSGGSFSTFLPSARLDFRLSENLSLSADAAGIISKGDFKYGDSLRRQNNDIRQIRGGINLFGLMEGGGYHVKTYINSADRGTPGAVSWPSEDRQKDLNAFLQGVMRKRFSPLYTLQVSAKGGYDDLSYVSAWGDSEYGQTEFQVNTSHIFRAFRWLEFSAAADLQWDGLKSTYYNASRLSALAAVSASFRLERFAADLAVEYSGAFDKGAQARNVVSPSLDFRFRIIEGLDVVAFGRRAYRVPVFNELYYVGYGNPDLKPEDAWLTDAGLDFNRNLTDAWSVKAKVDGYCNLLKDKIISAPTAGNPDIWLPYNIGKVRSAGMDALAGAVFGEGGWKCSLDIRYSFQSAVDMTPGSPSYGLQIPYTSRHSAMLDAGISWKGLELNPRWVVKSGRTDSSGAVSDWNTFDMTLSKAFRFNGSCSLSVNFSMRNLFDCRYELVSGYPMPGRSFLGGIGFSF